LLFEQGLSSPAGSGGHIRAFLGKLEDNHHHPFIVMGTMRSEKT
jgi:hypothetical protein